MPLWIVHETLSFTLSWRAYNEKNRESRRSDLDDLGKRQNTMRDRASYFPILLDEQKEKIEETSDRDRHASTDSTVLQRKQSLDLRYNDRYLANFHRLLHRCLPKVFASLT